MIIKCFNNIIIQVDKRPLKYISRPIKRIEYKVLYTPLFVDDCMRMKKKKTITKSTNVTVKAGYYEELTQVENDATE